LLALAFALSGCVHHSDDGWIALIDGDKGMENWDITGGGNWRAEQGAIQADMSKTKGASILVSKRSFKDILRRIMATCRAPTSRAAESA